MAKPKAEIPWGTLGQLLDNFQSQLNEGLQAAGHAESTAYLELTIYTQSEGDEAPRAEYNLGGGEIGKRLPVDDDIEEDDEAYDQTDDQEAGIDRLLRELYTQLNKAIAEFGGGDYSIRPGVRALIYSPNPGYSCRGYRCEWRASHNAKYLRQYYTRNGECRRRWTEDRC